MNIDLAPSGPGVIQHDLGSGLPLDEATCDAVYHSAVLEHFTQEDGLRFMQECHRVLKPGGVLRVAVPDLEKICRLYLENLEAAVAGDHAASHRRDWMLLELLDQVVREESGGMMAEYLSLNPLPEEGFVLSRLGSYGAGLVDVLREGGSGAQPRDASERDPSAGAAILVHHARAGVGRARDFVVDLLLSALHGLDAPRAFRAGRFRHSGEVHLWMYDRFSLAQLMIRVGFEEPTLRSPLDSAIPGWARFNLDAAPDGRTVKPDCLVMEAIKP